jgi:hypothetical protein
VITEFKKKKGVLRKQAATVTRFMCAKRRRAFLCQEHEKKFFKFVEREQDKRRERERERERETIKKEKKYIEAQERDMGGAESSSLEPLDESKNVEDAKEKKKEVEEEGDVRFLDKHLNARKADPSTAIYATAAALAIGAAYYTYVCFQEDGNARRRLLQSSDIASRKKPAAAVVKTVSQKIKYRSADAYLREIATTLSSNGVPRTFHRLLHDFLQKLQAATAEKTWSLHLLVAKCAHICHTAPIELLHQLCRDVRETTERMQHNIIEYERTYKARCRERYARLQHIRRQFAQFNDGQLVRLCYQSAIGSGARFRLLLPCSLRAVSPSKTRDAEREHKQSEQPENDVLLSLLATSELFPPDVMVDDTYYERWANVYRYAPTVLDFGKEMSSEKKTSPETKTKTSLEQAEVDEEKIVVRTKSTLNASTKRRKKVLPARRKRHGTRMDRIHADRIRRCAETFAAIHNSSSSSSSSSTNDKPAHGTWTVMYEYMLCPTGVEAGQALQKASVAAFQGLRDCVGMRTEYITGAVEHLETLWRDTVPELLQNPGRLQFQCNLSMLQSSSTLQDKVTGDQSHSSISASPSQTSVSDSTSCSRWIFVKDVDTHPAVVDFAVARITSSKEDDSTTQEVWGVDRWQRFGATLPPFLQTILDPQKTAFGCYAQTDVVYKQFMQLVSPHLPIPDIVALVLCDYGGILPVNSADMQLVLTLQ